MEFILWVIFFIAGVYFLLKLFNKAERQQKEKVIRKKQETEQTKYNSVLRKVKNELGNIDEKHLLVSFNFKSGLYFNESKNIISLFTFNNGINIKGYNISDILKIEVKENENTVIDSSSAGAGALVGSLVAGTTGAVIGGLAGGVKQQQYIKSLSLSLIVNDIHLPLWDINLFQASESEKVTKDNVQYKKALEKMNHWYGVLTVLISREQNKQSTV